jgi:hypothetical protein
VTRIRLLIDHNFGQPVADKLNELKYVSAITTIESGFSQRRSDADLVSFTTEDGCVFITHDHNTINEHRYPPCSHGGIIVIQGDWFPETVLAMFKKLWNSGSRRLIQSHVTRLRIEENSGEIHTHEGRFPVNLTRKRKRRKRKK